ncbi:transcriptional regulator [Afifella sp. IM 167]|uniref:transcriptional regulator n=1 Tax=Afifella sp. IM 167 TaxID=2033586 RepID=UPI001CCF6499|nr:transcriptional regulator [Afifella sp. IM 167]MBZ8132003.1 transcriptional regulator [Afifella sp. IM 167]
MRSLYALLLLGLAFGLAPQGAGTARAAELLMLQRPGCVWCQRWHAEIGPAYARTEEGQRAPIRFVDVTEPWPADLAGISREALTPTFVLVEEGVEIDRMRGYPGQEFFWPLFSEMLAKLGKAPASM